MVVPMEVSQRERQAPWAIRAIWVAMLFCLLSFVSLIHPKIARMRQSTPLFAPITRERLTRIRDRLRQRRAEEVSALRIQLARSLNCTTDPPDLPLPEVDDMLVFLFGIPVVPWLKRVGVRQWHQWLDHLALTMRARYPDREDIAPGAAWDAWVERHVHYVEVHFARIAGQRLAQLLNAAQGSGQIYLFGHSAGGSAVLQYLADLRDGLVPNPARPIRAVVTMDAAVTGPARIWTGWPIANERPGRLDRIFPAIRTYLRLNPSTRQVAPHRVVTWAHNYVTAPYRGLGAWARGNGIALLSVANVADTFSHGPLGDIPYICMRIGRRFDVRGIVTGKTHLCVQRDPRVPPFIWWHDGVAPPFQAFTQELAESHGFPATLDGAVGAPSTMGVGDFATPARS